MSHSKAPQYKNLKYYQEISANITYYRKKANLTQEEVAEKARMSRSHFAAIESSNMMKSFSLEALFDIAEALNIEPHELLKSK